MLQISVVFRIPLVFFEYEYRPTAEHEYEILIRLLLHQVDIKQTFIRRPPDLPSQIVRSLFLSPRPFGKGERVGGEGQKRISLQLFRDSLLMLQILVGLPIPPAFFEYENPQERHRPSDDILHHRYQKIAVQLVLVETLEQSLESS